MSESRLAITIDSRDAETRAKDLSQALAVLEKHGLRVTKTTDDLSESSKKTAGSMLNMASAAKVLGVALSVKGLVSFYKSNTEAMNSLDMMAKQIGITAQELDSLRYAAGQMANVGEGQFDSALRRMTRRIAEAADGGGPAAKMLKDIKLEARELANLSPDEQVRKVADAMKNIEDPSKRLRVARALMDVEGQALVNMFSKGGDAIREMEEEAQKLAKTVSSTDLARIDAADATFSRIQRQMQGMGQSLTVSIAPAAEGFADILQEILDTTRGIEGGTDGIQEVLLFSVDAADALWRIMQMVGIAIGYTTAEIVQQYNKAKDSFVLPDIWAAAKGDAEAADRALQKLNPANWFKKGVQESESSALGFLGLLEEIGGEWGNILDSELKGSAIRKQLAGAEKEIREGRSGSGADSGAVGQLSAEYARIEALLRQQIALYGDTTEAAKMRYETEHGSLVELSRIEKDRLVVMAQEYDALVRQQQIQDDYKSLLLDLRTEEEKALDLMRERVELLKEAGIEGEEYAEVMERISKASVSEAPKFGGLHPSVGGPSGELIRVLEAQNQLDEWRELELQKQKQFLDEKLINEEEYVDRVLEIETEMREQQQALSSAWQVATLGTFASVTGDAAAMLKELGAESSLVYKMLFLASRASGMAQAVVNTETAYTKALAVDPTGSLPAWVRGLGYASIGVMAATTVAGMAHDGLDNIPREGTWLLDKGERVLSPRQNADLTEYLKRKQSAGGSTISTVNVIVNINSDGSVAVQSGAGWQQEGAAIGQFVEAIVTRRLLEEMRPYGLLDRS